MDDSSNKIGRRGVEAIFTATKPKRNARFAIGILGILAGISLWLAVVLDSDLPILFGTSEIGAYLSTLLSSLGLILIVTGAGMCLSFSLFNRTGRQERLADFKDDSLAQELTANRKASLYSPWDGGRASVGTSKTRNFKFGLVALFQSCTVLALYSGLVDEYRSNPIMQLWIQSNLPLGKYFLNSLTALVIAAVLGLMVIQFLPGRPFAE